VTTNSKDMPRIDAVVPALERGEAVPWIEWARLSKLALPRPTHRSLQASSRPLQRIRATATPQDLSDFISGQFDGQPGDGGLCGVQKGADWSTLSIRRCLR